MRKTGSLQEVLNMAKYHFEEEYLYLYCTFPGKDNSISFAGYIQNYEIVNEIQYIVMYKNTVQTNNIKNMCFFNTLIFFLRCQCSS